MIALWLLAVAPFVGSFLGVLADRLPRGEDVIAAPSRCRACGRRLGWGELIPILSFVVQRGRCRGCGAALPPFLPLAEAGALGLAGLAVALAGSVAEMLASALWLWALLALALADLRYRVLPDALTLALVLFGLAVASASPGQDVAGALLSGVVGAGAFALLRLGYRHLRGREGMGPGDVKLMAGIGAALPLATLPAVTLAAACGGLALALVIADWRRGGAELPFGAFLAAGAALVWALLRI
jgi:leader peptidase (prepilin peptidase)/N-methyltransferase